MFLTVDGLMYKESKIQKEILDTYYEICKKGK